MDGGFSRDENNWKRRTSDCRSPGPPPSTLAQRIAQRFIVRNTSNEKRDNRYAGPNTHVGQTSGVD